MNPQQDDQDTRQPVLPVRLVTRILQGLLALALLYTLYFAKTLLVPIVVALLLTLLLIPAVNFFRRYHVPRAVSAILLLCAIAVPFTLLGMELAGPIQKWAQRLPELSATFTQQIDTMTSAWSMSPEEEQEDPSRAFFSRLFGGSEEAAQELTGDNNAVTERITQGGVELMVYMLAATPIFLAQLVTCLTLTIFLLVFGARLFDSAIRYMPQVSDKDSAHGLIDTIERELSRYILTVSVINALLGLSTAAALWLIGVEDALLWGVLVGLLNFAPYVGMFIGLSLLSLAGLAQYGFVAFAVVPALVYFVINGVEAQFVTPTVLGKHMRLNPLVLMIWLIIWAWLWGVVGVLLAVPLLVCIKLAASQLGVPGHWIRIIETRA
ncbi:MAG: AI-2E family transporter [Gammaproteobacteria bacterium]|nr:AI-2E family transporter [Gammaproteobacteria bacterium]|tara:strand:- start:1178 stop:2317 length:1140 start_codon:yes stop_codon:yes gene_type:complete